MNIIIIDYGAGNIQSILFALNRLDCCATLSNSKEAIRSADKVIFPGVGHAHNAMEKLEYHQLDNVIPTLQQPVLGICLGMQLMCHHLDEGNTKGLGIFNCDVTRFPNENKVPHMGWNTIHNLQNPLFENISEGSYMYFVHSYFASLCDDTIAKTTYGTTYSAALQKDNFCGVQFHPEKSSKQGHVFLKFFLDL